MTLAPAKAVRNIKNGVEGKKDLKRVNHYLYSYKLFYMNFQYLE